MMGERCSCIRGVLAPTAEKGSERRLNTGRAITKGWVAFQWETFARILAKFLIEFKRLSKNEGWSRRRFQSQDTTKWPRISSYMMKFLAFRTLTTRRMQGLIENFLWENFLALQLIWRVRVYIRIMRAYGLCLLQCDIQRLVSAFRSS